MASITIRNLSKNSKQWLRMRAAENGRSMEEEARLLFDEWQQGGQSNEQPENGTPEQPLPLNRTPTSSTQTSIPISSISEATAISASFSSKENGVLAGKNILLIISGGIAAYKCLELIRRLRKQGAKIRTIMTRAAEEFVTPLSVGALTAERVYSDLFSRDDEHDVGHIRLSREADLIVVAPATADLMAKMAHGLANDLASTVLLATNKPVLIAPAMNPLMWQHKATSRNVETLLNDGIQFIGPNVGEMAESGEAGTGRMAEPAEIASIIEAMLDDRPKPLEGLRAIVTSGPTREAIDPVRYLSNHSSGKQGHAIAFALAQAGADVQLISGPVSIADPSGVNITHVETAEEMQQAVEQALPADIAIFVAAVADWRPATNADEKIKKGLNASPPALKLVENPDILKGVGTRTKERPKLVIGFAAETSDIIKHGKAKLAKKGADWILANDVSAETGVMGGDNNTIRLLSGSGVDDWPTMNKQQVAERLSTRIVKFFECETIDV